MLVVVRHELRYHAGEPLQLHRARRGVVEDVLTAVLLLLLLLRRRLLKAVGLVLSLSLSLAGSFAAVLFWALSLRQRWKGCRSLTGKYRCTKCESMSFTSPWLNYMMES